MARLSRSYLDHLHILHPFLDERSLNTLVDHFTQRYNSQDANTTTASFAVPAAIDNLQELTLAKRSMDPKIILDKSPNTALILLVMALGKIYECTGNLPGPVPDGPKDALNYTVNTYSPIAGRTDSPPPSYPTHSSLLMFPSTRNVDLIPGLAYYAQASDILGNFTGFHDLANVQYCLLAGLYAGQLTNALKSLT